MTSLLNILLLLSFALTALCGIAISGYAVPFLYGMAPASFVRRMHLSMSHLSSVLMVLHLGVHIPVIAAGLSLSAKLKKSFSCLSCFPAGIGFCFFLKNGLPDYLFFRVPFAFLDYEKAKALFSWIFAGGQTAALCKAGRKNVPCPTLLFCCLPFPQRPLSPWALF